MNADWIETTLGDVSDFKGGSQPPKSEFIFEPKDGYVRMLQIRDFKSDAKACYIPKTKKTNFCSETDIMIGRYGASVGQIHRGKSGAYNVALIRTIPDHSKIDQDFFYYYLTSDVFQKPLAKVSQRSAQAGFSKPDISPFKFFLPPLEEQKRIVAILDEAFAGLDRARAHTEANLQNARDLFESVLSNVFEHEASEFEIKRLDDICDVRDGTHDSPKYVSEGVPLVTQKNVRDEGLTFKKCKNISLADHEKIHKRSNVSEGDILISMIGVNRGMTCLVDVPDVFSIKNVGLIKRTDEFNMNYLLYYLKSRPALEYVSAETNGGAQPFIGLKKLRAFPVAYAPIQSQNKSVSFLDGAKEESDKLATLYKAKLTDLDDLRQSLLQKAFAGELT